MLPLAFFFHELCSILRQLNELSISKETLLSTMAINMKRKFDKYWRNVDNINYLLFVAVVLGPRYKLDYGKYCLAMIYDSHIASKLSKKLDSTLQCLSDFYGQEASK